jgi:IclR family transcriptional regulator, acetate operon repressor
VIDFMELAKSGARRLWLSQSTYRSSEKPAGRELRPKQEAKRSSNVQSLTRALSVMKTVAARGDGATLTDITKATSLAASTAHRLLTTLQQDRFVRFEAEDARWFIGIEAFVVGSAFLQARDIGRAARPYLRRLMEESGETANLAIVDDDMAVYMGQVESRQTMRAICRPGGRVFLHSSALGKSMLALMPPDEVTRILATKGMRRLTQRTIDTPALITAQLAEVRAAGYAIDDEEYPPGLRCVAAAVPDEMGRPLGAVSISGPGIRVTRERLRELGPLVRSIANELSLELGGNICSPGNHAAPSSEAQTSTMRNVARLHGRRAGAKDRS